MATIKEITVNFIKSTGWKPRKTLEDPALRTEVMQEIQSWNAHDDHEAAEMLADTSCSIAEKMYGLMSYDYRRYGALYTACCAYVDDTVASNSVVLDAARKFGSRFARGEPLCLPALERLAALLKEAHTLFTDAGANAIITCTMDGMTAMALEHTTTAIPQVTRWPEYLRSRVGVSMAYAHFGFARSWRETPESYIQLLP